MELYKGWGAVDASYCYYTQTPPEVGAFVSNSTNP